MKTGKRHQILLTRRHADLIVAAMEVLKSRMAGAPAPVSCLSEVGRSYDDGTMNELQSHVHVTSSRWRDD